MTDIQAAIFDDGWQERMNISYGDLQWAATGERLTAESFARYRKTGGMIAVFNMWPSPVVNSTVASPLTIVASDGILENGKGHPRLRVPTPACSAVTCARKGARRWRHSAR